MATTDKRPRNPLLTVTATGCVVIETEFTSIVTVVVAVAPSELVTVKVYVVVTVGDTVTALPLVTSPTD
jgi:hypothetical protein